jgi:Ion channel
LLRDGATVSIAQDSTPQMPPTNEKPSPFLLVRVLARRRYFLLFLFLLASLIFYPYAESNSFGYYAFRVLGTAVIILCVYAVSFRRSVLIVAIVLAVPPFLHRILNLSVGADFLSILNIALSFAFDVFIVVVIFRRVFASSQPNSETIFGALSIYLLAGFAFASIYGLIAAIQPRAFYLDPAANVHTVPDRLDCVYYSFATMSSLGAAGITPVSGEVRCVSAIETIVGLFYLAVLISRLVGAYRRPAM